MWRIAVTLEELSLMTDEQVMMKINEFLVPPYRVGAPARSDDLIGAQFYMAELDRRAARTLEKERQAAEAERDRIESKRHHTNLVIEVSVLVLIWFELIFAVVEGHEQSAILDSLSQSTAATASTLTSLQASVDLNRAGVPTSKSLPVSIDVAYSPMERHLAVTNLGKSDISLLGYQLDGRRGPKFNPPDLLPAGETFSNIPTDNVLDHVYFDVQQPWYIEFHLSFKGSDGTEYRSTTILAFTAIKGSYHVSCGPTSITEYPWTRPSARK